MIAAFRGFHLLEGKLKIWISNNIVLCLWNLFSYMTIPLQHLRSNFFSCNPVIWSSFLASLSKRCLEMSDKDKCEKVPSLHTPGSGSQHLKVKRDMFIWDGAEHLHTSVQIKMTHIINVWKLFTDLSTCPYLAHQFMMLDEKKGKPVLGLRQQLKWSSWPLT